MINKKMLKYGKKKVKELFKGVNKGLSLPIKKLGGKIP